MKNFIFGLGTGRCGTMSLSCLLNYQNNANFTHELESSKVPWKVDEEVFNILLGKINKRKQQFVGDVGLYYLPYYEHILNLENSKFVILKRDKNSVVKSFIKKTQGMNHWISHNGKKWRLSKWDKCFPKFDLLSKQEAICKYYDLYYEICENIPKERCYWMATKDLNDKSKCLEMLEWCGFERPEFMIMKKNIGGR